MSLLRRTLLALAPVVLLALAGSACATDVENPAVAQGTSPSTTAEPTTTTIALPPGGRQPTAQDKLRVVLREHGIAPPAK